MSMEVNTLGGCLPDQRWFALMIFPPFEHFVDHIPKRGEILSSDMLHGIRITICREGVFVKGIGMIGKMIGVVVPENVDNMRHGGIDPGFHADQGMVPIDIPAHSIAPVSKQNLVNMDFYAVVTVNDSLEPDLTDRNERWSVQVMIEDKVFFDLIHTGLVNLDIPIGVHPPIVVARHELRQVRKNDSQDFDFLQPATDVVRLFDLASFQFFTHVCRGHPMLSLESSDGLLAGDKRFSRDLFNTVQLCHQAFIHCLCICGWWNVGRFRKRGHVRSILNVDGGVRRVKASPHPLLRINALCESYRLCPFRSTWSRCTEAVA